MTIRMPKGKSTRIVGALAILLVGFVGAKEGLELVAYRDIANIPTICFGETKNVRMGDRKTRPECEAMLIDRLIEHEQGMRKCLKAPDAIPGKTYGSFVSLTYNIGVGGFCGSSVARQANAGNLRAACDALLRWNKARVNGVLRPVRGLTIRRQEERAMCLEGLR